MSNPTTPNITKGPSYRPEQWRDLRQECVPAPRRNYEPGPTPVPLDSRALRPLTSVLDTVTPPASLTTAAPAASGDGFGLPSAERLQASRRRGRLRGGHRAVKSSSVADKALALLREADEWLTAKEMYRRLRERGLLASGDAAIHRSGDLSSALCWHVNTGRVLKRPVHRATGDQPARLRQTWEYRLASRLEVAP